MDRFLKFETLTGRLSRKPLPNRDKEEVLEARRCPYTNIRSSYPFSLSLAWAAARRAIGTRGAEQET